MSVAGGLSYAIDRGRVHGCETLQIFSRNASRWQPPTLDANEVRQFRQKASSCGIGPIVSHASYLINLATSDARLRVRSIDALADELDRADALGLLGVVLHPGCWTNGSDRRGLTLVSRAIRDVLRGRAAGQALLILENTAGQGSALGWRFEHLSGILEELDRSPHVGVCLDTCHLFAAGYDLTSDNGFERTVDDFSRLVGFDRLKLCHLNDSKRPLGSRVDRHEHIGQGMLGLAPFRRLLNDPRFRDVPMVIETPKSRWCRASSVEEDPLDRTNLTTLRELRDGLESGPISRATPRRTPRPRT